MKAREVKRAKLVAKYAAKRQALKEAGDYAALDKLPKNASQPYPVPRDGFFRSDPGCQEGELVNQDLYIIYNNNRISGLFSRPVHKKTKK